MIYKVFGFNKKNKVDPKIISANEFINIKNISGNILYTNDEYIFSYIRLTPIKVIINPIKADTLSNSFFISLLLILS